MLSSVKHNIGLNPYVERRLRKSKRASTVVGEKNRRRKWVCSYGCINKRDKQVLEDRRSPVCSVELVNWIAAAVRRDGWTNEVYHVEMVYIYSTISVTIHLIHMYPSVASRYVFQIEKEKERVWFSPK